MKDTLFPFWLRIFGSCPGFFGAAVAMGNIFRLGAQYYGTPV